MDGPQHVLLAVYSESDWRGSSGSLVVVTFFHDDVSPQRSFYWAGFIFPGLTSLGGWASACAVGGVFGVGSEGFEWFFGGGGGGGDLFSTRFLDFLVKLGRGVGILMVEGDKATAY